MNHQVFYIGPFSIDIPWTWNPQRSVCLIQNLFAISKDQKLGKLLWIFFLTLLGSLLQTMDTVATNQRPTSVRSSTSVVLWFQFTVETKLNILGLFLQFSLELQPVLVDKWESAAFAWWYYHSTLTTYQSFFPEGSVKFFTISYYVQRVLWNIFVGKDYWITMLCKRQGKLAFYGLPSCW